MKPAVFQNSELESLVQNIFEREIFLQVQIIG